MSNFQIELPHPPTTNTYWRFAKNGIVHVSQKGKTYRRLVRQLVLLSDKTNLPFEGRISVDVQVIPNNKRRRDVDNYFKCLLDSLTHAGVWKDDFQIDDLRIRRDFNQMAKEAKIIVSVASL